MAQDSPPFHFMIPYTEYRVLDAHLIRFRYSSPRPLPISYHFFPSLHTLLLSSLLFTSLTFFPPRFPPFSTNLCSLWFLSFPSFTFSTPAHLQHDLKQSVWIHHSNSPYHSSCLYYNLRSTEFLLITILIVFPDTMSLFYLLFYSRFHFSCY